MPRPQPTEYAPYYGTYIQLVPDGDINQILARQGDATVAFLSNLSEEQASYRYAPEKWSIKQVVGHVNDTERIFTYRALCFSRGDPTPLPGYDQDAYVANANFDQRSMAHLVAEFQHLRAAHLVLFRSFDEEMLGRRGIANNVEFTVRALLYAIAGHELHHRKIIQERYL